MPKSPDIRQNSDGGISDFQISNQSLIKENCHSSRTSGDIDMKLGLETKLNKRNKITSENFANDIMLENCHVVVIFFNLWPIWNNADAGFEMYSL